MPDNDRWDKVDSMAASPLPRKPSKLAIFATSLTAIVALVLIVLAAVLLVGWVMLHTEPPTPNCGSINPPPACDYQDY
jgi:hypothetical protein